MACDSFANVNDHRTPAWRATGDRRLRWRADPLFLNSACTVAMATLSHGGWVEIRRFRDSLFPLYADNILNRFARNGLLGINRSRRPIVVAINPAHPFRNEIITLSRDASKVFGIPTMPPVARRIEEAAIDDSLNVPPLFGSELRGRFIMLAVQAGGIDLSYAAEVLGYSQNMMVHSLQSLRRTGVLQTQPFAGRLLVRLSSSYPLQDAITRFVKSADAKLESEFAILANAATNRRTRSPRQIGWDEKRRQALLTRS